MQREAWLGPVREGDVSVMAAFWDLGYRGASFKRLNRVRKFLCVVHKSDLVACDGRTVMNDVLNRLEGESIRHRFPTEQPEGRDFNLWRAAVSQLCSGKFLLQPVGRYLANPHFDWQWTATSDRRVLYRQRLDSGEDRTDVFS